MPRRTTKSSRGNAALLAAASLLVASCGSASPEQQLLMAFFQAARQADSSVLARYGTVSFNPRTEGTVEQFDITSIDRDGTRERVSVNAHVRTPQGTLIQRSLVLTLEPTARSFRITALGG